MDEVAEVVIVHTDGACHGNPGPGGWAAWWESPNGPVELLGGCPDTTNNRMEIQAIHEALAELRRRGYNGPVRIRTDSQYALKGATEWRAGWERRGWRTAAKEPVKNADLWRALFALTDRLGRALCWEWVRGHSGDMGNERADALAQEGLARARHTSQSAGWRRQEGLLEPLVLVSVADPSPGRLSP